MVGKDKIVKLHIDSQGYQSKPEDKEELRTIKPRLQRKPAIEISIAELMEEIAVGKTVSPAVMRGSKSSDFIEQQAFFVDIDNTVEGKPILTPEKAYPNFPLQPLKTPCYGYSSFSVGHYNLRPAI